MTLFLHWLQQSLWTQATDSIKMHCPLDIHSSIEMYPMFEDQYRKKFIIFYECCSLISYVTRYLFCCRMLVISPTGLFAYIHVLLPTQSKFFLLHGLSGFITLKLIHQHDLSVIRLLHLHWGQEYFAKVDKHHHPKGAEESYLTVFPVTISAWIDLLLIKRISTDT